MNGMLTRSLWGFVNHDFILAPPPPLPPMTDVGLSVVARGTATKAAVCFTFRDGGLNSADSLVTTGIVEEYLLQNIDTLLVKFCGIFQHDDIDATVVFDLAWLSIIR